MNIRETEKKLKKNKSILLTVLYKVTYDEETYQSQCIFFDIVTNGIDRLIDKSYSIVDCFHGQKRPLETESFEAEFCFASVECRKAKCSPTFYTRHFFVLVISM